MSDELDNIIVIEELHADMVNVLAKPGKDILRGMNEVDAHLTHMVLGVAGEAGELVDCIKKRTIYRKDLDRTNLIEELGDLEFYIEGIRAALGITRQETLWANYEKLKKRYEGLKYTDAAAINRADKS